MADHKSSGKTLYWPFQILGWGFYYLVNVIIGFAFVGLEWTMTVAFGISIVTGFFISHFFRRFIHLNNWKNLHISSLVINCLIASVILAIIWCAVSFPATYLLKEFVAVVDSVEPSEQVSEEVSTIALLITLVINYSIIYVIWFLIYFGYHFFTRYKQAEVDKWKLEAAVKDAELIALKSQINPHFIFNCLNNIRSLVIENPGKARDMITHLSGLLRYSVQFNNAEKVSLESELEIVQNYLNLESIQFEDRLEYKLNIDENTLEEKIPPMAIQLLVENAIKHGISDLPDGGEIRISSHLNDNTLIVEVQNTGQLKEKVTGTGIGLKNASDRLKLIFGKLSDLKISNQGNNMVSAKFTIPLN
ncbi:MAG: histidine kinase [Bacteroidota bacterium]